MRKVEIVAWICLRYIAYIYAIVETNNNKNENWLSYFSAYHFPLFKIHSHFLVSFIFQDIVVISCFTNDLIIFLAYNRRHIHSSSWQQLCVSIGRWYYTLFLGFVKTEKASYFFEPKFSAYIIDSFYFL